MVRLGCLPALVGLRHRIRSLPAAASGEEHPDGRVHFRDYPNTDGMDMCRSWHWIRPPMCMPRAKHHCLSANDVQLVGVAEFPQNVIENSHVNVDGVLFQAGSNREHTPFVMRVTTYCRFRIRTKQLQFATGIKREYPLKNTNVAALIAGLSMMFAWSMPSAAAIRPRPPLARMVRPRRRPAAAPAAVTAACKGCEAFGGDDGRGHRGWPAAAPRAPWPPQHRLLPPGDCREDRDGLEVRATAAASNTDPAGATAKCKDGTYSKSQHHSGTCSSHGGVAEWLTAKP